MAGAILGPVAVRIQFPVIKSVRGANGDYIIEGIASDEGLDLESEVVKATGWLKHIDYLVNQGKITWDHQPGLILGEILQAEVKTPEWVQKHFGFQPTGRALYLKARVVAPNDEMDPDQRKALQVCRGLLESGVQLGLSMEGARVRSLPAQIGGQEAVETVEVVPTGCSITPSPVNPRGVCRLAKSLSEAVAEQGEDEQGPAVLVCRGVPESLAHGGGSTLDPSPTGADLAAGARELVGMLKSALAPAQRSTSEVKSMPGDIGGRELAKQARDFVVVVKAMLDTGYGTDSRELRGGAALRRSGLGRERVRKARKKDRYERAVAAGAKLGSGARFRALAEEARAGGARDPEAVAAAVGRKKYGAKRMAQLAAAGRKRHS
ncbi:MAG: hypothetical protein WC145_06490 [Aliarcobacter sp.]